MAGQITYEVYVQQGSRWEIHSRYNAMQKEDAVQEAKSMETMPSVEATKVVKEVYDPREGVAEEFTIYKSETLRNKTGREIATARATAPPISRQMGDDGPPRGAQRAAAGRRPAASAQRPAASSRRRKKKQSTLATVMVKILLVVLFSVAVAALITAVAVNQLPYTKVFGIWLTGNTRHNVLFGMFVVSFIISTIMTARFFLSKNDFAPTNRRRSNRRPAPPPPAAARRRASEKLPSSLQQLEDSLPPDESNTPPDEKPSEDEKNADDTAKKPDEGETLLTPHAEQQKAIMMKFLGQSLEKTKSGKSLDNYNKFGVNLYLAGACESISKKRGLDDEAEAEILSKGVQIMGFNQKSAESFSQKKEEYLLADSRYMQMYHAGRNAMNSSLEGDGTATGQLDKALTEWNTPKAKDEKTGPITVMFTDMVGSTALTQERGDAAAQEVVRAHNRVVREALSQYAGREIKHTGDGIMASFDSTSNSVEASILIQQGAAAYTRANPDLPLHLKIGINSGEPIKEDDDLFGSTVQLSARIVDKASKGEIYVSEIVRGICAGKPIRFKNVGDYDMKGFADPITLFEVEWDDVAGAEAMSPAQAAE